MARDRNVNRENCELLVFAHIHQSEQVLTSRRTERRCAAAKKVTRGLLFKTTHVSNQQIQQKYPDRQVHRDLITENSISSLSIHLQLFSRKRKTPPTMPPVRTSRNRKPPPEGFDDIEDTLLEFSNKMKDAENAPHDGKKKHETLWPIFQISHQRELTPYCPRNYFSSC